MLSEYLKASNCAISNISLKKAWKDKVLMQIFITDIVGFDILTYMFNLCIMNSALSYFRFQIPSFKLQIINLRFLIHSFGFYNPILWFLIPMLEFKISVLGFLFITFWLIFTALDSAGFLVLDIWFLAPIPYSLFDSWHSDYWPEHAVYRSEGR